MNPAWIDTHCHLDSLDEGPETILDRASAVGVDRVITVGTDLATSKQAVEIAGGYPGVRAAVGVHPSESSTFDEHVLAELEVLAGNEQVAAIGEIGLDFYREHSPPEVQEEAFRLQLGLARSLGLAVVLHARDAYREMFDLLGEVGPPERFVFHCFSGGREEALEALDLGGHLSFAGNISYKTAENLRDASRAAPLDRLLVETDSPYLAPVPHRGKPNEPGHVVHVGKALAEAREEELDLIARATTANAIRVFDLTADP